MSKEIVNQMYHSFEYNEQDRLNYYTDSKGRTALCFTCAYDGYCQYPMRYTKCKYYIKIERNK